MNKKVISVSRKMRGQLDDDYTLYDDGTVLHEYDKHNYPYGHNLSESLTVLELSDTVKHRLLDAAPDENKEIVRKTLDISK